MSKINFGDTFNQNLGILYIIKGEYNKAVTKFGTSDSFNKALARYINQQNDDAITTLGKVKDLNAMVDYLKAAVFANKGEEVNVMINLLSAFEKDASLKAFAKDDLEFRNFFENDKFKGDVIQE
jgi:lipopolysaccharide biosynthesis regulator YciM